MYLKPLWNFKCDSIHNCLSLSCGIFANYGFNSMYHCMKLKKSLIRMSVLWHSAKVSRFLSKISNLSYDPFRERTLKVINQEYRKRQRENFMFCNLGFFGKWIQKEEIVIFSVLKYGFWYQDPKKMPYRASESTFL